jgi:glycosyltransferase involved in cell wall biosynthesis
MERVVADGRFLSLRGTTFVVKGVTYGSFAPRGDGRLFPESDRIESDLNTIAACGFNTVRLYNPPPVELLDVSRDLGLRLLVGLDYHDLRMEPEVSRRGRRRVLDSGFRAIEDAMAELRGRPEVLAVSVGNEFPGDLVRLHGVQAVGRLLGELVDRVHEEDPEMLVTYTSFPTTGYLEVPGIDLATTNVFLEERAALAGYLRHLQIASGPIPLIVTELGLAAEIHGEKEQADALSWQLETVDAAGLAGATIFSWTDEWAVAGESVEGWGFGLTDSHRVPKPALEVASAWTRRQVRDVLPAWPRVTVVVCAFNEEKMIEACLRSLEVCDYPDLEVIVCDDGSEDSTLDIIRSFPFKTLTLDHGGLSRARNAGIEAASGEIIAFLDADAVCHPEWPYHLALSFDEPGVVASGGPNLPFRDAGMIERCVDLSPGAPMEVLVADDRAEHVPGCNMAFRADAVRGIGGFDPVYTSAGDDVDVCWKLLDRGGEIAFAPMAQVIHHRRSSVRGYLRQQRGYGRAERLLVPAHPNRFNRLGQARWSGFIYGESALLPSLLRPIVYHGPMGLAPYQKVASRPARELAMWGSALVPLSPVLFASALLAGLIWPPATLLAVAVLVATLAFASAVAVSAPVDPKQRHSIASRLMVAFLHLAQPIARSWGRLRTPLRPLQRGGPVWTGDRQDWLNQLVQETRAQHLSVRPGAETDPWDIRCAVGPLVRARVSTAVAWGWTPRAKVEYRASGWLWAGCAALVAAAAAGASWAPWMALIGLCAVVVESFVLRRRVRRALHRSMAGAEAQDQASPS